MNARKNYEEWCARTDLTEAERAELAAMADDEIAITKAFGATLSFGTAGLRGIMGMGSNCLNRFTIAWATAGIAEWLLETGKAGQPVVISTDSRLNHKEFARTTALVLAQYGFPVLLWRQPTATPILSWSVRHFQTAAGIMITASHNPRDYNGYKAYDANGCQLLSVDASIVTRHADTYFSGKPFNVTGDFDALCASGAIRLLDEEIGDYLRLIENTVAPLQDTQAPALRIGFTPLHGVGGAPVRHILEKLGMDVAVVKTSLNQTAIFQRSLRQIRSFQWPLMDCLRSLPKPTATYSLPPIPTAIASAPLPKTTRGNGSSSAAISLGPC